MGKNVKAVQQLLETLQRFKKCEHVDSGIVNLSKTRKDISGIYDCFICGTILYQNNETVLWVDVNMDGNIQRYYTHNFQCMTVLTEESQSSLERLQWFLQIKIKSKLDFLRYGAGWDHHWGGNEINSENICFICEKKIEPTQEYVCWIDVGRLENFERLYAHIGSCQQWMTKDIQRDIRDLENSLKSWLGSECIFVSSGVGNPEGEECSKCERPIIKETAVWVEIYENKTLKRYYKHISYCQTQAEEELEREEAEKDEKDRLWIRNTLENDGIL